jgi:rhodanese-related sulfurtransferase
LNLFERHAVKFLADNILLVGLAIGSAFMLLLPLLKRSAGGGLNVSPAQAVMLINRSNAVVIDVRDAAEFAAGHIVDACHIPLAQLAERVNEIQKFKDKMVLVNCQDGVHSAKACEILNKNTFTKVHNLEGGLNAWIQAKLPVVKA